MSQTSTQNYAVVIVPEGLAADARGNTTAQPSGCYRAVLDYARQHYGEQRLYLAPANNFGGAVSEQAAALHYLQQHHYTGEVIAPPSPAHSGYIDTRANASLLRAHFEAQQESPPAIVLIAGKFHIRRAALCFRREGFEIHQTIGVPYTPAKNDHYPRRLCYYRHPLLHRAYESLAHCYDSLR